MHIEGVRCLPQRHRDTEIIKLRPLSLRVSVADHNRRVAGC